jgi:hypothetical protein
MAVRMLFMVMVLTLTLAGWAAAEELNVPQRYQLEKQWSWVGCTQALSFYYGVWLTQPQIARQAIRPGMVGEGAKDGSPNPWKGLDGLLRYFAAVETVSHDAAFTPEELSAEMADGRPVVIRWDWVEGGGHLLILRGINQGVVSVLDPWQGPSLTRYDWLVSGGNHTWTHTLEFETAPGPRRLAPFLLMLMKAH